MSSGGLSIGELVGTISLDDALSGGMDKISNVLGISKKSMEAVAGAAGLLGGAIVGATTAIIAMGVHGSEIADVQDGFEGLTAAAGESADVMLGALQRGTLGTISNFDLMKLANTALGSGLIKSSSDMETLAAGAKLLSGRVGGDTAQAFDTLTTAVAKGKTATLKQLGVFVDSTAAVENYARSIHKNVGDLSDHEKATAISRATLAALKAQLDANGPATASFSDNIDRGKVAVQNFIDNLSVAIAKSPVVAAGMDSMAASLKAAFGGTQQSAVKTLMGYVNDFAIGLTYAGQAGVVAAQVFVTAWSAIKLVVLGVMTVISAVGTGLVSLVAGIAQLAAEIPGAGKLVDGFAVGATKLALAMDEVTQGLAAQTGEANAALAGHGALQDKLAELNTSFVVMRDTMEKVANSEVDLGAKAPTAPIRALADAVTFTDAQFKVFELSVRSAQAAVLAMADDATSRFTTLQDDLTLANLTGVEARLFEIQQAQEKELAGIAYLQVVYPAAYDTLASMIQEKYRIMGEAAQGYFESAAAYAEATGFQTRDQMEQTVASALTGYMQMLQSGQFTAGELIKAWKRYKDAKTALDREEELSSTQKFELIASSASTILRSIFGKSKAAAIAAVIIDTAAAIVKTLAAYPYPWSLIPAAAAAAAGYAQIQKIRAQDLGFAMGTPDTAFVDFGRSSLETLHGREAVVTPRQGASVAGMVEDALTLRDNRTAAALERVAERLDRADRTLPTRLRDAMQLAMA